MQLDAITSPGDALAHASAALARAARDKKSPLRWPVLSTASAAGVPSARTVVLRGFDAAKWQLHIYTDARSAKITDLTDNPHAALTFYDPRHSVQIRMTCKADILTDGAVHAAAANTLTERGLRDYSTVKAPGTTTQTAPPDYATRLSAAHFAVICLTATDIDWLHLGRPAHRRMRANLNGDDADTSWVVP